MILLTEGEFKEKANTLLKQIWESKSLAWRDHLFEQLYSLTRDYIGKVK
jgi:hypothetical protein